MEIFAISDSHFYHKRIIELAKRPFSDVNEMHEEMVRRWNAVVGSDDEVIFGGDFMFADKDKGDFFNRLNGKKRLVIGNHDHSATFNLPWVSQSTRLTFNRYGKMFVIDHYPIENWNGMFKGSIHLYGHVHNNFERKIPNRHCMCAEAFDYTPRNLKEFLNDERNL